jgi:leucyl/phenylalanyl-tRNA--protein transferase
MSQRLFQLGDEVDSPFPPPEHALQRPNGLLAWGGDLHPDRLLRAYQEGIFPWFSEGEPVLWWTPDPRCVLWPHQVYVSSRTRRRYNSGRFRITADTAFAEVINSCAAPRDGVAGTWITRELKNSFMELHERGITHSVEVWQGHQLVGGIYGMALGRVFFGESMFSRVTDASKLALVSLCRQLQQWSFGLLDCQVTNPHLLSMGAVELPRARFIQHIENLVNQPGQPGSWRERFDSTARW